MENQTLDKLIPLNDIVNLSYDHKIELMEILRENISEEFAKQSIPGWHQEILEERLRLKEEGKETYEPWEDVRKEILGE